LAERDAKRGRMGGEGGEGGEEAEMRLYIEKVKAFLKPALIIAQPRKHGEPGTRPVASTHETIAIPGQFTHPIQNNSSYLLSDPSKGLDGAIMQDWATNPEATNDLLQIQHGKRFIFRELLELVYGEDYTLVVDRMSQFTPAMRQSPKKLKDLCHVDWPAWQKKDPEECPPVTNVYLKPDHVTIIAIDQGRPHSVPASAGDAFGVYVGAVTRQQRELYNQVTASYLSKKAKKPLDKNQHFLGFNVYKGIPGDNRMIQAGCLLTGSRPIFFPSAKPIQMPQPFNGSRYKLFNGYQLPDQSRHDLKSVLLRIRSRHGDRVGSIFEHAARDLCLGPCCAKDPSSFETYTLARFLDLTE